MRVFLDTNVLVSAFASRGLCADLFELVLLEHDLLLGSHVVAELDRSLRRKLKLSTAGAGAIVTFVSDEASKLVTESQPVDAGVDQADARVLGQAIAGRAEAFVTGDSTILRLGSLETMKIVSPRGFWELIHG